MTSTSALVSAAGVDKGFLEDVEATVQLLVGGDEWDEDPDDVPVQAAGEEDQASLTRARRGRERELRRRFPRSRIADQLEREHRAQPSHLADLGNARPDLVEARLQALGDLVGPSAEA